MEVLGYGLLMLVGIWIWFPEQVGKSIAKTVKAYRAALDKGRGE